MDANLIAHCANPGYIEEATICKHILQSLISHPKLHSHQASAPHILFKIAGAAFAAYVEPSVVDRCCELLRVHGYTGVTQVNGLSVEGTMLELTQNSRS